MNCELNTKSKERADKLAVIQGLAETRQRAQALIMAGLLFSGDERIEKPGQLLGKEQPLVLKQALPYVSRGGLKLAEALKRFEYKVKGKIAADLGVSTGGFTDCLLKERIKRVYAVDVDIRQVDWNLQNDSRVVLIKKNARYLEECDFPESLDIVTMDLSFISVLKVFPAIKVFLGKGDLLSLIKPQFEAGKGQVGKAGVVRNPFVHEEVLTRVIDEAQKIGFYPKNLMRTSICGQKGNREFFILWTLKKNLLTPASLKTLIKESVWDEKN